MIKIMGLAQRAAKRAPMEALTEATISKKRGLADDFRGKPHKRQVSVLSLDSWQRACAELNMELAWTTRRANVLIQGYEFTEQDVGKVIRIGDVVLKICEETDPCPRMDEQQPGLTQALMPAYRGGVCCAVIQGGDIKLGDAVSVVDADFAQPSLF